MIRGKHFQSALWALCLLCMFGFAQPAIGEDKDAEKEAAAVHTSRAVQRKIEPSIVCLEFWTGGTDKSNGSYSHGTGFVISDPKGKKWIVTTAHSLAANAGGNKIKSVMYYLPTSGERSEPCAEVVVDEQYDLAMLSPSPKYDLTAPALTLANDTDPMPSRLYAVGTAIGLPVHVECSAEGQEPDEIVLGDWLKKGPERFAPLAPDLVLIRHRLPIAPGHSGSPVVNADGRVFGIQSRRARVAENIGFAVHVKHLRNFLSRPTKPMKLADLALASLKVDGVLTRTNASHTAFQAQTGGGQSDISQQLTIKLGRRNVEAPFIYHGYVEADATTVIQKYIEDRDCFLYEPDSGVRLLRLQQLLRRTRIARISNPLFGLQMLVPEGYQYSVKETIKPTGMVVTLSPPVDRKPSLRSTDPVAIWLTVEPALFEAAREHFIDSVKRKKCVLTAEQKEFPSLLAIARENWEKSVIVDQVEPRFCNRDLNIQTRVSLKNGTDVLRGDREAEIFDKTIIDAQGSWRGSMNISATGSLIHSVRIASREPLVVIVHSQRTKDAFQAFNSLDGDGDLTDCETAFIAASVSLR